MTRATAAAVSLTVMACGDAGGASSTDAPGSETEPATSGDTSTTTGADTTGVPTTSEATGETSTDTTTGEAPADELFVVAVGEQGSILHCREDGCESMPSPVSTELDDVVVLAADRAFAVGSAGVVLAWDGAAWTVMDAPTTANLSAVAALDDQTLFVGGSDGAMLRWDGATWTEVEHPVQGVKEQTVHEIAFAGPDFGLAVVSSSRSWASRASCAGTARRGRASARAWTTCSAASQWPRPWSRPRVGTHRRPTSRSTCSRATDRRRGRASRTSGSATSSPGCRSRRRASGWR
ncbi:WD40/YVTN/BNR-like repeat-containing protein [Nannocystis pusilla]|uniref:WD40/YVTN/BNR-like repeat-containing protein n=1 Tax=Nannocystis pusilla TaxID=889268 RepID=UPI003B7B7A95